MTLPPPVATFTTPGNRTFTVKPGEREERYLDDPFWCETWPVFYGDVPAGKLFRSLTYGKKNWHASTRALYWRKAADAPTGIGFDVAAFDTAEEALAAWAQSADQILDWAEGKPVPSIYSKTGVVQKK